jgi:hypothetical protein
MGLYTGAGYVYVLYEVFIPISIRYIGLIYKELGDPIGSVR